MDVYKRSLIIGIVVFAFLSGIYVAAWGEEEFGLIAESIVWFMMFCFVTYLVIRAQQISPNALIVVRFILFSILGIVFLWFKPWIELTSVSASSWLGIFLLTAFRIYLTVVLFSATIYCVAYCSALPGKTLKSIEVVRFFLVALLATIICMVFSFALILMMQVNNSFAKEAIYFLDGLFSQLAFGITYYYAIGLLLDKSKSKRLSINE